MADELTFDISLRSRVYIVNKSNIEIKLSYKDVDDLIKALTLAGLKLKSLYKTVNKMVNMLSMRQKAMHLTK